MIRKKLAPLVIAASAVLAMAGFTSTASAADLKGAGSTLMAPLMSYWTADYQQKFGVSVAYGAVGSGAGIQQITARAVDFGASDAPLKPSQSQACNQCVQIPWALTAVTMSYNLPGIKRLKLSPSVISAIYLGHITSWNDPRIKRINRGVSLPNLKITPAFRSDGSGDTYAFTNYLWKISREWKQKVGIYATSVNFPAPNGVGGKGNDGIAAVVKGTPGAIGYISASYAITHGLSVAAVQNAAGKFAYPNLGPIKEAAKTIRHVPANNELHIVSPSKRLKKAYPISTFSYAIVPKSSPRAAALKKFILYAVSAGQRFGNSLDFAPLPASVTRAATAAANGLA